MPSTRCAGPRAVVLALALTGLAGCAGGGPSTEEPSFYQSLAASGVRVDAGAAASMISGYRRNHGLPPVRIDPDLMNLAEEQARAMATRNRLSHEAGGEFTARLNRAGYRSRSAAENISAGYHTLANAFSGWRDSRPHRANMLLKGATRMGIAAVYAPKSKYKVFWALILAEPER